MQYRSVQTRLAATLCVLGAPSLALAQSWDQRLVAGTPEGKLSNAVAATDTTLAFGQPKFDPWGSSGNVDEVRVYELQAGSFVEVDVLTSAEPFPSHASFGAALDMEGDLLVVGDPAASGPGFTSGAVHVYRRVPAGPGGTWTLDQVLRPTAIELSALEFGAQLDLEGNRLVIGAPTSSVDPNVIEDGAVYVFEDQGAGFVEVQRVDNPQPTFFGTFGRGLALDGDRLLVGAPGGFQATDGAAFLFDASGGSFALIDTLMPDAPISFGGFGSEVALDGSYAAIQSPGYTVTNVAEGLVTVFEDQGSGLTEVASLENTLGQSYTRFGSDLEFEGGSLFATSERNATAQRYDRVGGSWTLAESYITQAGFTWGASMLARVRSVDGRVFLTEPAGATVFEREVPAELEVNCDGDPHPQSATGFPVILDVRGQLSLSEPTLPMNIFKDAGTGPGVVFYGFSSASKPFGGATLCVQSPVVRVQRLDSNAFAFELDLQSKPIAGTPNAILAGTDAYFQYWFRVPGGQGTHLSNSLRMVFAP